MRSASKQSEAKISALVSRRFRDKSTTPSTELRQRSTPSGPRDAMGKLQVMIVGAGTGGLCLAHGLRASGLDVRVFERDRKLTDRTQGYRLTINADGARALRSCLPKANFERFIAASAKISTAV